MPYGASDAAKTGDLGRDGNTQRCGADHGQQPNRAETGPDSDKHLTMLADLRLNSLPTLPCADSETELSR